MVFSGPPIKTGTTRELTTQKRTSAILTTIREQNTAATTTLNKASTQVSTRELTTQESTTELQTTSSQTTERATEVATEKTAFTPGRYRITS